jgi:hypothetical protein
MLKFKPFLRESAKKVIFTAPSLKPRIDEAQKKVLLGTSLEVGAVCGGLWFCAGVANPVTTLGFLALLGIHTSASSHLRILVFNGIQSSHVTSVALLSEVESLPEDDSKKEAPVNSDESAVDRMELEVTTDNGVCRKLELVPTQNLPESSKAVTFRELLEYDLLKIPDSVKELEILRKEDWSILTEDILTQGEKTPQMLTNITKDRLEMVKSRMSKWQNLRKTLNGEKLIDAQANQQLFIGSLTLGISAVFTISALQVNDKT